MNPAEIEAIRSSAKAVRAAANDLSPAEEDRETLLAALDEAKRATDKTLDEIAHLVGREHVWDYGCQRASDEEIIERVKELAAGHSEADTALSEALCDLTAERRARERAEADAAALLKPLSLARQGHCRCRQVGAPCDACAARDAVRDHCTAGAALLERLRVAEAENTRLAEQLRQDGPIAAVARSWFREPGDHRRETLYGMLERAVNEANPRKPPVPRGHCNRCDRCGFTLVPQGEHGCWATNCSMRPMPAPRSTCAGCGAPFEQKEGATT